MLLSVCVGEALGLLSDARTVVPPARIGIGSVKLPSLERLEVARGDGIEVGLLKPQPLAIELPVQSRLLPPQIHPELLADAENLVGRDVGIGADDVQ